jgi:hypothetical protein
MKRLAKPFKHGRGTGESKDREAAAVEFVDEAEGERQLRPHDGQVRRLFGDHTQ